MKVRTHAPARQSRPAAIAATPQPSRRFQTRAFPQPNTATGQLTVQARQQSESMGQLLDIPLVSSERSAGEPPAVQTKLTIGQPNDKYEQEADRTAAQVMATPDTAIQREIMPEKEEETLQTKPQLRREAMPGEDEELRMKSQLQQEAMPEEEEETSQAKPQLRQEVMHEEEEKL